MKRCHFSAIRREWNHHIRRFCDVWLEANGRSPKTIRGYRSDLTQFSRFSRRRIPIKSIDREVIENWLASLRREDYSSSSIRRKLASLRSFYEYLVTTRIVTASPAKQVLLRLGRCKKLTRVVQQSDLRQLLRLLAAEAAPAKLTKLSKVDRQFRLRDTLMVWILAGTGIRVAELVAIRVEDYRPAEASFIIQGKGNRERLAFVADKTTTRLLNKYMQLRANISESGPLFLNPHSRGITTETVRHVLRTAAQRAGIQSRITPHMLRHTAATSLLENGVDLRLVQEFLGHDSIRSTERYTHVARGYLFRVLCRASPLKKVA